MHGRYEGSILPPEIGEGGAHEARNLSWRESEARELGQAVEEDEGARRRRPVVVRAGEGGGGGGPGPAWREGVRERLPDRGECWRERWGGREEGRGVLGWC